MRTPLRIGNNEADPRRNYAARSRRYRTLNRIAISKFQFSIGEQTFIFLFFLSLEKYYRNWKWLNEQLYELVDIYFDPKVTSEFFQILFESLYRNQSSSRMQERYYLSMEDRKICGRIHEMKNGNDLNHLIWNIVKTFYFPLDEKICNLLHKHHQGWSLVERWSNIYLSLCTRFME